MSYCERLALNGFGALLLVPPAPEVLAVIKVAIFHNAFLPSNSLI